MAESFIRSHWEALSLCWGKLRGKRAPSLFTIHENYQVEKLLFPQCSSLRIDKSYTHRIVTEAHMNASSPLMPHPPTPSSHHHRHHFFFSLLTSFLFFFQKSMYESNDTYSFVLVLVLATLCSGQHVSFVIRFLSRALSLRQFFFLLFPNISHS